MRKQYHLLLLQAARARCQRVQHGLPDMGWALVHHSDGGTTAATQLLAELGRKQQAADATADDDDSLLI